LLVLIAIHLPTLLINLSNPTQSGLVFDYNISKFHWKKKSNWHETEPLFWHIFVATNSPNKKRAKMWSHHKHTHMCVGACALYCCCWSRTGNDELHHRTSNAQTRGARLAAICDNRTDVTTSYFQFSTQQTAWPTNTRHGHQTGPGVAKFVISASNTSLLLKCGKQQRTPARLFLNGKKTRRFWQKQTRLKQQQIVTMGVTTIDGTCSYFG
jgi:hypothetical protein